MPFSCPLLDFCFHHTFHSYVNYDSLISGYLVIVPLRNGLIDYTLRKMNGVDFIESLSITYYKVDKIYERDILNWIACSFLFLVCISFWLRVYCIAMHETELHHTRRIDLPEKPSSV